ncbi:DNA/RNA non-specific endonuclease [Caulobacter sp. NIBR1757]|uniref:DNA/RNA non-specific endonuclease n=1 Tax=Caulobacter sp. NIBR1757 TaxID=3016000 RepID=UPI0022F04B54|nr:DNA/RNA non-specific endonuclease [Caulobacter sp. NIBR1757]WGM37668.1 hypothetical protein AMEJIAPC_00567 [Caulobacter sp. NIBR1757]
MDEERLESVKRRLTPELRETIRRKVEEGRLPPALQGAMSNAALSTVAQDKATLESAVGSVAALEAIVQRYGRPPLLVRNQKVVLEPLTEFPADIDVKIKAQERWIPSVGRIEFFNASMSWGGTGWVVDRANGSGLVVTNRHVAKIVARRAAGGQAVFLRSLSGARCGAAIDFNEEIDSKAGDTSATVRVSGIEYLADDFSADVALLRLTAPDIPTPLELSERPAAPGELVALIGYPAYDSRNDDSDQARYFRDLYEVKRFAPGRVMQVLGDGAQLTYDCTSLGGNSGSPVISLDNDGKVVGLHFSGVYGKQNTAVGVVTLKALVAGERPVGDRLLSRNETRAEGKADGRHAAGHFKDRKGFDTDFLEKAKTPWPGLPAGLNEALAKPQPEPEEPNELRYTHFGLKYSGEHRMPLITAVNIDGARSVRIKREADQWFLDGRIDEKIQLKAANFKDLKIDRGHMVRREDPNWSTNGDESEAQLANDDTFHYVNACAQHSALNQGKTLWQGLENYILDSARTHGFRACVFTGPVVPSADDGEDLIEIDGALAPIEFWKLVVTLDAEGAGLHATAYLLSQGQLIRKLMEDRSRTEALEGFTLGAYRTFQLSVKDLAEATGYDFGVYVDADPLAHTAETREALKSDEPVVLSIESLADIQL